MRAERPPEPGCARKSTSGINLEGEDSRSLAAVFVKPGMVRSQRPPGYRQAPGTVARVIDLQSPKDRNAAQKCGWRVAGSFSRSR